VRIRNGFLVGHLGLVIAGITATSATGADALYGRQIGVPKEMRAEAKAAVQDLQDFLRRMTGQPFAVSSDAVERGIVLRRVADADVPAEAARSVPGESREAFALWPEKDQRLWLVARSDHGLAHAVYTYLEHLGCRWYFPSERWTFVPERGDIRLDQPIALAPAFRSRFFFGSGGFGGNLPLDPRRELQARWMTWQQRNRFGGEFLLAGHSGEAFNLKHRKTLEEHPEYRAMVSGERVPWSQISKFCPANKEVVDLFVRDRLDTYRLARKADPQGMHSWAVSVEPADGGGHCDSPEARALGSVSDRVFHVANQVARAVRAEFPNGWVSLYAYNEHAAVPAIPLEPNVYVMVIPYAFQRTGLLPEQLLDAWSKKVPRLGVYDYWSIPDWSHDLPTFDFLGFGPDRLRGWHARHIDSFNCESTFSSGAMGPAWYIGTRLAWDPKADEQALFDDFLKTSFGPAAPPMRRMLTRWASGFHLTTHELALSYRDLDEAWRLAEGQPERVARVADYGRYVEYLRLYFEYLQADAKGDAKALAAERLMRHLWGIYDSTMVHAFRLSQLLAREQPQLGKTFDWRDPKAPGWAGIRPLTDAEVRQHIQSGMRDLQPLEFTPRRFTGPLVPAEAAGPGRGEFSPVLWASNSLTFDIQVTEKVRTLRLRIGCEKAVRVLVRNGKGESVADHTATTGEKWQEEWSEVALPLPGPGLYAVQLVSQKRTFRLSVPDDMSLALNGWYNSQGRPTPPLYFFVPKGVSRVAIYANYTPAGPPRFFDPAGKEVKPELFDNGKMILFDVPESQRGAIWSLDRAKCPLGPLSPLNVPNYFSFHRNALLVPADALR
jgi:hypothetical protein